MNNERSSNASRAQVKVRVRDELFGCAYGVSACTIVVDIELPLAIADLEKADWAFIDPIIAPYLEADSEISVGAAGGAFQDRLAGRVLALAIACLRTSGLAIFSSGRLLEWRSLETRSVLCLALPSLPGATRETVRALVWALALIWPLIRDRDEETARQIGGEQRRKLIEALETKRLGGTNTLRFLEAAHEIGIPVPLISSRHCQFGWGKNKLLAQSSVLDTTKNLGVATARDKNTTAQVLIRAGLPGPTHRVAPSWEDARRIAAELGYPVVIKPANLDGGIGVFAGLRNERQLADAWRETAKHGKKILVEKHCEGEDFRLIVIDGTLRWAVGRQPAGVTGDGEHSISQLVEISNRDPRRGYHAAASLRPLVLGEEALGLLEEQGHGVDDVIEKGRFVRLRRSSNLSSGGMPLVVTDMVHPDNRALVERAVDLIGLDVAGVDMIIPDIAASWRETGATIIEVNAQPQLIAASQGHLYADILRARIAGNGRIPTVLALASEESGLARRIMEKASGPHCSGVGVAAGGQAFLGGASIGVQGLSPFRAGQALLMHRDVEALVVLAEDYSLLKTGLPFDRFDMLVLAGPPGGESDAENRQFQQLLDLVADHCGDRIVVGDAASLAACKQHDRLHDRDIAQVSDLDDLADHVLAHAAGGVDKSVRRSVKQ